MIYKTIYFLRLSLCLAHHSSPILNYSLITSTIHYNFSSCCFFLTVCCYESYRNTTAWMWKLRQYDCLNYFSFVTNFSLSKILYTSKLWIVIQKLLYLHSTLRYIFTEYVKFSPFFLFRQVKSPLSFFFVAFICKVPLSSTLNLGNESKFFSSPLLQVTSSSCFIVFLPHLISMGLPSSTFLYFAGSTWSIANEK